MRYRFGDERLPPNFWSKAVMDPCGCWRWTGAGIGYEPGYGRFQWNGRLDNAHRVSYSVLVGPIPLGLFVDHLCRNRWCVNPGHLEPVTIAENNRRAGSFHGSMTHCKAGHPYDDRNTLYLKRGGRSCRPCHARRMRERKRRLKAARSAS